MFRTVLELGFLDSKIVNRLRKYIANGEHEKALAMLEAFGRRGIIGVTFGPTEFAHRALRFKPKEKHHYIMPEGSTSDRDQFIKEVEQRVFTMKAGWGRAAIGLNIKTPASLKRHFPGQGGFKLGLGGFCRVPFGLAGGLQRVQLLPLAEQVFPFQQ